MTATLRDPGAGSGALQIAVSEQGTTKTITLRGPLSPASERRARQMVADVLRRRPERVVLDVEQLSFLSPEGAHVLEDLARRCAAQAVQLIIIPGSEAIPRTFTVSRLGPLPSTTAA